MKKITFLLLFSGLFLFNLSAFSQTYDWESATDHGTTVTETVSGVTATVTTSNSDAQLTDGGGFEGSTANVVFTQNVNTSTSLTITFSAPVNVGSIFTFIGDLDTGAASPFVFTPTGGSNSVVNQSIDQSAGEVVILNWTGVTAVTLTLSGGGAETFGIDDIVLGTVADTTPPEVESISHAVITQDNSTSQLYTVTFNEAVSNVTVDDFELTKTGTADGTIGTPSTSDGGITYSVDVTGISGTGTLRLDLKSSTDIIDGSGNGNGTNGNVAAFTTGDVKNVDTDAPAAFTVTSSIANGNYGIGQFIQVWVIFSEAVVVTGTPQLTLETGTTDRTIDYAPGGASNVVFFNYTVQAGDISGDLDYVATNSLTLNGGTIQDAAGNTATITLPTPGASGSLAASKVISIDGEAPSVVITSSASPTSGAFTATFTFSEPVASFAVGDITVGNGAASAFNTTSASVYTATITPVSEGAVTVDVNASVAQDGVGNNNTAATQLSVTNDVTQPTVAITSSADPTSGAFTATFTFSEDVTGFVVGDITVGNGAASAFNATSASVYTATITPASEGAVTVDVNASVAQDLAGNNNTAATQLSVTNDETQPTVAITSSADPTSGAFTATFTFSEDVTGFVVGDITVGNGAASAFTTTSASVYTATITPVSDGAVTIDVNASVAQDLAGNNNTAATQLSVTNDETQPTVAITSSADPTSGAFTATFTFSEDVTGFVVGDITVGNGAASAFTTTSASVYTATITPVSDGAVTVDVNASVAQDLAGNNNTAATQLSVTNDETQPTVAITSSADPTSGAFTATFTFSEDVTGFVVGDITVGNGAASAFTTTSASVYTATITPVSDGAVTVDVNASVAQDLAGNNNTAATQLSVTNDETQPTVAITSSADPTSGAFTATFTFSEDVTGFVVGDITVGNGAASAFTTTSASVYTATITPVSDGAVTIDVNASVAQDSAGNNNTAATQLSVTNDETKSTVTNVSSSTADGSYGASTVVAITVTFDEVVVVTGTPQLTLETGIVDGVASYASGSGTNTLTFNYTIQTGNITSDLDYVATNSLTAGTSIQDTAGNDATLTLPTPGTAGSLGANKAIVIDAEPTVTLSVDNSSIDENSGTATLTATLSAVSTTDVTVGLAYSGTAINGTDYNNTVSTTIVINAGSSSANAPVIITPIDDGDPETNETIIVDITTVTNGSENGVQQETITLVDDDTPNVAFSTNSSDGLESVSSTVLTVNSSLVSALTVTVDYTVTGTATGSGTDYTLANGTLTFNPGSTSENITLTGIVDDAILEANETVIVTLSNPSNANLGVNTTHTYTITDNDAAAVTIADVSGNENDGAITFTATLDNAVQGGFTVDVSTADGTATTGDSDYTAVTSQTLTFAGNAGETQTFTVTPTGDLKLEANETFTIAQSNLGSTSLAVNITDGATGTITNDDSAAVTIENVTGNEDDGSITVTATLDNAVQGGFTVDVNTADGTATTADSDYTAVTSQTLTFAGTAGETQTFTVTPTTDTKVEADESFTISQSNLASTSLAVNITDGATATITNDDTTLVTIADVAVNENDGTATVTLTSDKDVDGGFSVDVNSTDGTATMADSDYVGQTGTTKTFTGTAGEMQTVVFTLTGDTKLEADETFTVSMNNLVVATVSSSGVDITDGATVTINNDDSAAVTIADISGNEDDGVITVTATLDNAVQGGFTVDVSTADGTATTADSDYTAVTSQTLTFVGTAGEMQTFTVTPTIDTKVEVDETLTISQSNLGSTSLAVNISDGATVTVNNDDTASVTIDDVTVNENDGTAIVTLTLDNAVNGGFTVDVSTADGTATTANSDYTAISNQTVTFAGTASETETVTVTIGDDAIGEETESFTISMSGLTPSQVLISTITITDTASVTILDDDAPVVTSMTPVDDAVDVTLGTNLTITYNQDVVKGTGNILLRNKRDDSIIQSIDVTSSQVTIASNVVTIDPSSDLPSESQIYVEVPAGAFQNSSSQGNEAITGDSAWNFTTEDVTSPTVTLSTTTSSPTNSAFTVSIVFSEAITNFDLTDVTVTNGAASVFNQLSSTMYSVLVTPASDGEVTVSILAGVLQDDSSNSNNNLASNVLNLTYDGTRPTITITSDATDPINTSFTVTFTISEELAEFEAGDVTLTNVTISDFVMVNPTLYTATITPVTDGIVSVEIQEGDLEDNSNNENIAAIYSTTYDITNPIVTITSTAANPINMPFMVTFTFNEDVTGFELSDVMPVNGTASDFVAISPTVYTALITPTITVNANVTVDVNAGSAFDSATNPNNPAGQFSISYDAIRPVIAITTDVSDPTNTDFTATFTFSEDVTGFDISDIEIENGSLSNFVAVSASVYTVLVTPDSDGEITLDVDENLAQDVATNGNEAVQYTIEYDITQPTVDISTAASDPTNGAFTATILFSEDVTGFDMSDIVIVNGTLSTFTSVNNSEYTVFVTPVTDGPVSLEILDNIAQDAATNGNEVSDLFEIQFDGTRPTVTITTDAVDPTNTSFTATFTFSEDMTGFDVSDITVGNGSAGSFTTVSTTEYTANITPASDGMVTVDVAADVAVDTAANGNEAATQYSVLYDGTNPTITMSTTNTVPVNGPFTLDIVFDEPVTGFDASDINVTDGTFANFTITSATMYSILVTPTANLDVTINISAGSAEDAATNGNDAAQVTIAFDNVPPLPPQVTHISDYTCSGDTSITGDNTLEISGTAEANSMIEVFENGSSIGTTVTEATGFFTFDHTGTTLADGTYNFTVTATDSANNTSDLSAPLTITINSLDTDNDGIPDVCDDDYDGNGVTDTDEDCDNDGIVDHLDTDNSTCSSAITQTRQYGFSPNGDGVNDGWYIENITAYPNSVVQVYSRSGKLVFKKKGYQNDWEGVSNQISTSSNRLPVGPYIFIIDLGDGSRPTRGWIYINY